MIRTKRRTFRICLAAAFAAWAMHGYVAPTRAQQTPVMLDVKQEFIEPQPRIGRMTGISLVGVVAERGLRKGATLNVDLLLPPRHLLQSTAPLCITARSQDARFSFQGEAPPGLPQADTHGRVRVGARIKPESAAFLSDVDLAQLAMLARLGSCAVMPQSDDGVPTIIAMDPWPEAGGQITTLRVLLNAPEGRVSLAYGPRGGTKVEQPCARSAVKEAGAFATECRVSPPLADHIEVEIRRHRFNNKPLVDRFELIGPTGSLPRN